MPNLLVANLVAALLLPTCGLAAASPAAASNDGTRALAPAFQSLVVAMDAARVSGPSVISDLKLLRENLLFLEQNLNHLQTVPKEYDISFQRYGVALARVPLEDETIRQLSADVELKNRFLNGAAGFWPLDKIPLILVHVSTYRGTAAAPGYGVAFTPLADADREEMAFPVASNTNDAVRQLPPGNYFMRIYRGVTLVFGRSVAIGFAGTDKEDVKQDVSGLDHADSQ